MGCRSDAKKGALLVSVCLIWGRACAGAAVTEVTSEAWVSLTQDPGAPMQPPAGPPASRSGRWG